MIENAKKLVIFGDFGVFVMKKILLLVLVLCSFSSFAQDNDEVLQNAKRLANNFVFEGNEDLKNDNYVDAEMAYRKAISNEQTNISGLYNLGTSYVKKGNYDEALYRLQQAAAKATSKPEKHKAYHNIGNILMQNKQCKEAVEAYKNALRNDPSDNETRYNFGLAKACAEQQKQDNQNNENDNQDQNKDQNQDNQDQNQDQNKDNQDQDQKDQDKQDEGDQKDQDNKDQGDQDQKEGDQDEQEDGKPKDDKQDPGQGDQDKKEQPQQPKPQQGQMSPQQIKNLLEAMNNQEQKVQEKMNAEKTKGVQIQTDKDW